jgi:hypothetical protein
MNIGCEKPGNSFPFRGTVLEDIQKMAVTVHSIVSAIQNMTDCNTVCSMLWQMKPEDLSYYQGNFLTEAVKYTRYDLLTTMVRELNFSVDSLSHPIGLYAELTALSVSALEKNRQMSKFLIQELKADVNKAWLPRNSETTCSVLTFLIARRDLDELKFFLVSVLYNSFSY